MAQGVRIPRAAERVDGELLGVVVYLLEDGLDLVRDHLVHLEVPGTGVLLARAVDIPSADLDGDYVVAEVGLVAGEVALIAVAEEELAALGADLAPGVYHGAAAPGEGVGGVHGAGAVAAGRGLDLGGGADLEALGGYPGADDHRRGLAAGEGALAVEHAVVIAVEDALAVGLHDGLVVLAGQVL